MIASSTPAFIQRYSDQIQKYSGSQYSPTNANSGNSLNNDYAVGSRTYNGSSPSPQAGAGGLNMAGYQTRDNMAQAKNNALANMIK